MENDKRKGIIQLSVMLLISVIAIALSALYFFNNKKENSSIKELIDKNYNESPSIIYDNSFYEKKEKKYNEILEMDKELNKLMEKEVISEKDSLRALFLMEEIQKKIKEE